jgi:hypothetical protein
MRARRWVGPPSVLSTANKPGFKETEPWNCDRESDEKALSDPFSPSVTCHTFFFFRFSFLAGICWD